MMLHDSRSPIFDQTVDKELPEIPYEKFLSYIENKFRRTEKPILEEAAERIVKLSNNHPKRTQQLAAAVWDSNPPNQLIDNEAVEDAYDDLLERESSTFRDLYAQLAQGTKSDVNEARALFILAIEDQPLTSRGLTTQWGLTNYNALREAAERLRRRGIVERKNKHYRITDPLLRNWLKTKNPL
jgi:hypothetical protein